MDPHITGARHFFKCTAQIKWWREELSSSSDLNSSGFRVDLAVQPREGMAVIWHRTRAIESPLVMVVVIET